MKLRHNKPAPDAPQGRRRPLPKELESSAAPAQAFSYYSQRSAASEDSAGRRKPIENKASERKETSRGGLQPQILVPKRLLLIFGAVLIAAAVIYCLPLTTRPHVVLVQDKATSYFLQDQAVYTQAAQQALSGSLFNRNKLTVDTSSVRLALLKNYPEIQDVSVTLPLVSHQPLVAIEPYKPSFILTTTASNAFLLDSTGRALSTTNAVPNIEKLGIPTLQDRSGLTVKLGSRAVPSTTVSFAETVVSALKQGQVTASSLVLPPAAYELDVSIAETPYFVKFSLQNDPLQQAGTFLATKGRLDREHTVPTQYVDVRVPERAYYK